MNSKPTRRQVASAAAWSAPTIALGAAAPAVAASQIPPPLTSSTRFANANFSGDKVVPYSCSGRVQVQIQQSSGSSFLTVKNISPTTQLTNLAASYWLALDAGTTFTRVSGSSTCWTVPTRSGASQVREGATFYEFVSTYTCPITVTGTSWSQPTDTFLNFVSSCQSGTRLTSSIVHYTQTIVLDGKTTLTKDNGWSVSMQ